MITAYRPISTCFIYCPIPTSLIYYRLVSKTEYRPRYIFGLTQYLFFFLSQLLKFKTQVIEYTTNCNRHKDKEIILPWL